jgi:hypothetical protein
MPYENNPTKHILNAKYKYTFNTKLLQVGINLDENAMVFIANSNTINTNKITYKFIFSKTLSILYITDYILFYFIIIILLWR